MLYTGIHSLVVVSRGYSLVAVCRRLNDSGFSLWTMDSRFTGFSSCSTRPQYFWQTGLVALEACGIFVEQGSNCCSLYSRADF